MISGTIGTATPSVRFTSRWLPGFEPGIAGMLTQRNAGGVGGDHLSEPGHVLERQVLDGVLPHAALHDLLPSFDTPDKGRPSLEVDLDSSRLVLVRNGFHDRRIE